MKTYDGYFISFEGGEGSGKTTAMNGLRKWFESQGYEVLVTREPGGIRVSEMIRNLLVNESMDPLTEALLFVASRNENTQKIILPALKEGKIVLCDRFVDSSYVYQGIVRGLGLDMVKQINKPITDIIIPDKTLYFDIEPEVGLERIRINNREVNRFDKEEINFHNKVREGYLSLTYMEEFAERMETIDADQSPEQVVQDCISCFRHIDSKVS